MLQREHHVGRAKERRLAYHLDSSLSRKPTRNNKARPRRPRSFIAVRFVF
jgi:hypothetical protein